MKIKAVMISCVERDQLRPQTLANLAATDWGDNPVWVQMDQALTERRQDRQEQTAFRALEKSLTFEADYILFLEDDLDFNKHLRHNLESWYPLRNGGITLAGLYNPNIGWWRNEQQDHYLVVDHNTIYGSQCFLLSKKAIEYCLKHWIEVVGMQDMKISRLAARMDHPIYYHTPSLVQHVGAQSVWGGCYHQAVDFHPTWKA